MDDRPGSRLVPRRLVPFWDVAAVSLVAVATVAVAAVVDAPATRVFVAVPLLAVGPGYALLAVAGPVVDSLAAVPGADDGVQSRTSSDEQSTTSSDVQSTVDGSERSNPGRGGSWPRRVVRAVAASLVLVSLLAVSLELVAPGAGPFALTATAAVLTVGLCVVAGSQRARRDRAGPPFPTFDDEGPPVALFAVSLIFLVITGAYVGFVAPDAEGFTEFHVGAVDEDERTLDPGGFTPGEPTAFVVGIDNRESARVDYTVVARVEVVGTSDGDAAVVDSESERRFSASLAPGESRSFVHEFVPPARSERVRAAYYLYRGPAPADPGRASADQSLVVWENGGD